MRHDRDPSCRGVRMSRFSGFIVWCALVAGAALVVGEAAARQMGGLLPAPETPASEDGVPGARAATAEEEAELRRLAVDGITRMGLAALRGVPVMRADDYRMGALTLRVLCRFVPEDVELLRLQLDAWNGAGDSREVIRTSEALLRLDPRDTVTQLRLISAEIGRFQDVDSRLATYERFLGPRGSSLDASIRSRLALDAALLARENGDETLYRDRLLLATQLDITNKEAAALYATEFLDRATDPLDRLEILSNLVLADPVDVQAYHNVASELLRNGAFAGAKRFLDLIRALVVTSNMQVDAETLFDAYIASWGLHGPRSCLEPIDSTYREQRAALENYRARRIAQGLDPGPEDEYALPVNIESIRYAVYLAIGDRDGAAESLRLMNVIYTRQLEFLSDPANRGEGMSEGEWTEARLQVRLERVAMRLIGGLELNEAAAEIEDLRSGEFAGRLESHAFERFNGLIAAHRGDTATAAALLEPLVERDRLARYGMALAMESDEDSTKALLHYAELALGHPHTALGAIARTRIEQELGKPVRITPDAARMNDYALAFAPALEQMVSNPNSFMALNVDHVRTRVDILGRMELRVRLRNASRMPLALGAAKPINSRVLLSPSLRIEGEEAVARFTKYLRGRAISNEQFQQLTSLIQPEVVSLDRRLRLRPGETVEAVVWVGKGPLAILLDMNSFYGVTLRWRAVQGFFMTEDGRFEVGPMSLSTMSDVLTRDRVPEVTDIESFVAGFGGLSGRALAVAVLQLNVYLRQTAADPEIGVEEQQRRIGLAVGAVTERTLTMSPYERVFTVTTLAPLQAFAREDARPALEAMKADEHPLVRLVTMLALVSDSSDPVLDEAASSDDPAMRELATLVRGRIAALQAALRESGSGAPPSADPPSGTP